MDDLHVDARLPILGENTRSSCRQDRQPVSFSIERPEEHADGIAGSLRQRQQLRELVPEDGHVRIDLAQELGKRLRRGLQRVTTPQLQVSVRRHGWPGPRIVVPFADHEGAAPDQVAMVFHLLWVLPEASLPEGGLCLRRRDSPETECGRRWRTCGRPQWIRGTGSARELESGRRPAIRRSPSESACAANAPALGGPGRCTGPRSPVRRSPPPARRPLPEPARVPPEAVRSRRSRVAEPARPPRRAPRMRTGRRGSLD